MREPLKDWSWDQQDADRAAELAERLPPRIFDAHAHCYRKVDIESPETGLFGLGPEDAGLATWRQSVSRQLPGTEHVGGLFFPIPRRNDRKASANAYLAEELKQEPRSRGLILVGPDMTREQAEEQLAPAGLVGFKPYHVMATIEPTFEAPMSSYLPDWCWELADRDGLFIMMHMVRHAAMADPENQREIRHYCQRYPNAKLILAHAARGFCATNTERGIEAIADLRNVWCDTSGICEARAITAILRAFGPSRVMWGSDYPVNEGRGKAVTVGDNFSWINPVSFDVRNPDARPIHTWPVGLESAAALIAAADSCYLNEADLADLFANNALRLLGIETAPKINQDLYRHAKTRIPAGGHLLSKRPEMLAPEQWPPYFYEARGCEVWDLDRNHYYDFSHNGVGATILGVNHPDVSRAVQRRLFLGNISSLNPAEEVALADKLCQIHPWAEQARFARTGGEVAAVAVRIARATTKRSGIAICGYHGWHDWYLAANLGADDSLRGHLLPGLDPTGVPGELRGTAHTWHYEKPEELAAIIAEHGDELAAVVMEPCRSHEPDPAFLEQVRDLTHGAGALLIFDEITIGLRRCLGGSHIRLGVNPDMAMFGKSLGNGHPIAAVIGTQAAMAGAEDSFISSSYWTEATGFSAALATLEALERYHVPEHVDRIGKMIASRLHETAERHGLKLENSGFPCTLHLRFDYEQAQAIRTLYTQLMLGEGFLAGGLIYVTLAHTEPLVARFGEALDRVFPQLVEAIAAGDVEARLKGPVAHSGFQRLL